MTLEEAIKHEEEIVKEEQYEYQECVATHNTEGAMNCRKYAEEHRQLAKWLKDYKRLLEQEPCEDAISRQAVLNCLTATGLKKYDFILNARDKIKNLPSVKPQELKIGHWISHREHCEMNNLIPSGLGSYFWCSECDCGIDVKEWHRNNYNYCPNCGAKMV